LITISGSVRQDLVHKKKVAAADSSQDVYPSNLLFLECKRTSEENVSEQKTSQKGKIEIGL
jgi:hypothetical protein